MNLEEAGFGHVDPKMPGRRHSHASAHEFHYIRDGVGRFFRDGRGHGATGGLLFHCPPGMEHDTLSGGVKRISLYYVRFRLGRQEGDVSSGLDRHIPESGLQVGDALRPFFSELLWKFRSGDEGLRKSARLLTESLLLELASGHGPLFAGEHNVHVQKILDYLQKNLKRSLTLAEIAGEVGMNPSYLVRLFRKHMGRPPLAYFTRLRLESAGHWLRRTDASIASVAEAFGFGDPFHFSAVFRRHLGLSPSQYREQFR